MTHTICSYLKDIELVQDKLFFSVYNIKPKNTARIHYFAIENDPQYQYQPFASDFGPLSLLHVHRFYTYVSNFLNTPGAKQLHFVCSASPKHLSNAIFIASCFRILYLDMNADEAFGPFNTLAAIRPYRDASSFPSTYDLSVISCIQGFYRAYKLGWYDPNKFDPVEWEENETVSNGDMNWLIPHKLLAFASPYDNREIQPGWFVATPSDLIPTFSNLGVNHVVRLSKKFYDEKIFKRNGITHTELFFPDGSTPPPEILKRFLDIIEGKDVIALHCKAGLGRTGTLAACYMIKNYDFTADEAMGWIRICRPGSIIGPQQQYLVSYYSKFDVENQQNNSQISSKPGCKSSKQPQNRVGNQHASRKVDRKTCPETPQTHKIKSNVRDDEFSSLAQKLFASTPKHPQPRKSKRAGVERIHH